MMKDILQVLGLRAPAPPTKLDLERDKLRHQLGAEIIGIKREKIALRTALMNEMIEGPERPRHDH